MKFSKSVGVKVVTILTLGIVMLCFILGIMNIFFLRNGMTREFDGRILALGENLASSITDQLEVVLSFEEEAIMKTMLEPIRGILESIVKKEDISYIVLKGMDGETLLKAGHTEGLQTTTDYQEIRSFGAYKIYETRLGDVRYLAVRIPINKNKNALGEIHLGFSDNRLRGIVTHSIWFMFFTSLMGILTLCFLVTLYIRRSVSRPLKKVTAIAKEIADGHLAQEEITIVSSDEIGQLAEMFNRMVANLGRLTQKARLIAEGKLNTEVVEKRINSGEGLDQAVMHEDEKNSGDLEEAFDSMLAELRKLTVQARIIAADDLNNALLNIQIQGEFGAAFYLMTTKLREFSKTAGRLAEGDFTVNVNGKGVLSESFGKVIESSREMADNAARIADGDLTVVVNLRSEKDSLGRAFSKMVTNLKSLISSVKEQSEILSQSAKMLSSMAEQSTKAIAATTQNLQTASTSTREAHASSLKGEESLKSLLNKITMIKSISEASSVAMQKLSIKSSQISEIVSMITKFADQTNLLSLNAAIEAARAGEAGMGFAVVADEVRKLAENSAKSAQQISKIVGEVQVETKEATESALKGQQEVNIGTSLTEDSNKRFREIVDKIENITNQIEMIAAASEEITASSQETTSSTAQLANSSKILRDSIGKFTV